MTLREAIAESKRTGQCFNLRHRKLLQGCFKNGKVGVWDTLRERWFELWSDEAIEEFAGDFPGGLDSTGWIMTGIIPPQEEA